MNGVMNNNNDNLNEMNHKMVGSNQHLVKHNNHKGHMKHSVEMIFIGNAEQFEPIDFSPFTIDRSLYRFCITFNSYPATPRYEAFLTFIFDAPVADIALSYTNNLQLLVLSAPQPSTELTFPVHSFDGENYNGWSNEIFLQNFHGFVVVQGAALKSVILKTKAVWVDPEVISVSQCDQQFHTEVIIGRHFSPHFMCWIIFCIIILLAVSICACCCCSGGKPATADEETVRRPTTAQDDEEIVQLVQQQSLDEYNSQTKGGEGYMRIPVVSSDLYAQYLAVAQKDNL